MQRLYISSSQIIVKDLQDHRVKDVAVYDPELFHDYLTSLTLNGPRKLAETIKSVIYRFVEFWDEGETRISMTHGDFTIMTYPTEYIEPTEGLIHVGTRPANPEGDIKSAVDRFATALSYKSPNAAAMYQELQDILKKYPTYPVKESV